MGTAIAVSLWLFRGQLLAPIGTTLVLEDPIEPVEVIVVSNAAARASALEASALYAAGMGGRVILPWWQPDPLDLELQALGVPWLLPTDFTLAILERKGVPRDVIEILPDPVDGLNSEVKSVGRFAQARHPKSLMFLTARSHTRRARWLLARVVPADIKLVVRSSSRDTFAPGTWWYSRENGREAAMEYLRWINTFLLADAWHGEIPSVPERPR